MQSCNFYGMLKMFSKFYCILEIVRQNSLIGLYLFRRIIHSLGDQLYLLVAKKCFLICYLALRISDVILACII